MGCSSCQSLRGSVNNRYLKRRKMGVLRGLSGDCYAGFPGQPDAASQPCRGLSGVKAPQAVRQYLKCLSAAMGFAERIAWDEGFHADFYSKVRTITFGTDAAAMPSFPEAWGDRPEDAARLVANYPTMVVPDGDSFWDCIGIAKTDAVASMQGRSGEFYDLALQVGLYVNAAEGGIVGSGGVVPKASIVGSLIVAAAGIGGLMWLGRR